LEAYVEANQTLKTPKRLRLGELQAVDVERLRLGELQAIDVETLPMGRERFAHFSSLEQLGQEDDSDDVELQAQIQTILRTVFAEWKRLESTFNVV
jgi:hypothetical protein